MSALMSGVQPFLFMRLNDRISEFHVTILFLWRLRLKSPQRVSSEVILQWDQMKLNIALWHNVRPHSMYM